MVLLRCVAYSVRHARAIDSLFKYAQRPNEDGKKELVEGRLVGAGAVRLGASLRLAAYVFHREATKARRVRGGVRAVGRAAPL
jgi:hypothetical protein